MSLLELVDDANTDKNTVHSYLGLYEQLLKTKKTTAKHVLEVGIQNGGSIKLWSDFFTNATVYGMDLDDGGLIQTDIAGKPNIVLLTSIDAYSDEVFSKEILGRNIKFDFMLDDGPHTYESMVKFIHLYSQVMTDDGILIIEDVQDIDWLDYLKNEVPQHLRQHVLTYDLRENKGRYDDIVFTIDKRIGKTTGICG
jgi:hypothetical protein